MVWGVEDFVTITTSLIGNPHELKAVYIEVRACQLLAAIVVCAMAHTTHTTRQTRGQPISLLAFLLRVTPKGSSGDLCYLPLIFDPFLFVYQPFYSGVVSPPFFSSLGGQEPSAGTLPVGLKPIFFPGLYQHQVSGVESVSEELK